MALGFLALAPASFFFGAAAAAGAAGADAAESDMMTAAEKYKHERTRNTN